MASGITVWVELCFYNSFDLSQTTQLSGTDSFEMILIDWFDMIASWNILQPMPNLPAIAEHMFEQESSRYYPVSYAKRLFPLS